MEYKWNWFENRISDIGGWGDNDRGGDLGNPLGKNSHIYIFWDNCGIDVIRGGGAKTLFSFLNGLQLGINYLDLSNDLSNDRVDKNYNERIREQFNTLKRQLELDSLRLDSIRKNEEVGYDIRYIKNVIPRGLAGWNDIGETQIRFGIKRRYTKRKDSLDAVKSDSIILILKIDSILKKSK